MSQVIKTNLFFLFFMLIACTTFANATASDNKPPQEIGRFGDWAAYTMVQDGKKVCYAASTPKESEGKYTRRGDVYALITHRPGEATNVISFHAGYPFAPGATVVLTIDKKQYKLFTEGETAWAPNNLDKEIAIAITNGSKMAVDGISGRGTKTKDVYSLNGATRAWHTINNACNVRG
jgi:hypothetical protein